MPILQAVHYEVGESAFEKVKTAVVEFVEYVRANDSGSRVYTAWQEKDNPARFVHPFEFADREVQATHGSSAAVRKFEAVYEPELVGGPVVFADHVLVASNVS